MWWGNHLRILWTSRKIVCFQKRWRRGERCKGVKKPVVSKSIHLEDYKRCLFTGKEEHRKMNVIRSREHELFTETVNKIALSANDDKRIIQPDKIQTLAYGFRARGLRKTGTEGDTRGQTGDMRETGNGAKGFS